MTHIADSILAAWLGVLTFAWYRHAKRDERWRRRLLKLLDRLEISLDELTP